MVRFLLYVILGAFVETVSPVMGEQATSVIGSKGSPKGVFKPLKRKKDIKGMIHPANFKADDSWIKKPQKKTSGQKATEKKKAELDVELKAIPPKMRPLSKKTILIDARRLGEHKFTETIRYIKEHPHIRLKLQNMTIDAESVIPLMKGFKEANVIDQIRDIGFVMLPGPNNQVLNEKAFMDKVLPYLGHLEGIELSCLGVSDKVVSAFPKMMPHLKSISLFGMGVTDATVIRLAKELPNLVKIHLINTSLTDKGIQGLVNNFPYLRALGISSQNLENSAFTALKEALKKEALKKEALKDGKSKLYSLSMVGQTFKDMNTIISLLASMPPDLRMLDLSETNVTDQVAKNIPTTVTSLNISETSITDKGVKEIVKIPLDPKVPARRLTMLKMNNLKNIGKDELSLIIENQPGLRKFQCAGAYLTDAIVMKLILNLTKLIDVTLIPMADSEWMMSESIAEALAHKKVKLQYLRIPPKRLTEDLRLKLQKEIAHLRIEYEG